ncbi:hypothetical protein AN933_27555 [Mycobacterium intracellulare subsp. chimaera]|nr:hypothetical protein AN933_27555 [Mycobacterium intracellulare subsp. chimaera]
MMSLALIIRSSSVVAVRPRRRRLAVGGVRRIVLDVIPGRLWLGVWVEGCDLGKEWVGDY